MSDHGTASEQAVLGWYVEFQLAALRALPRDISQEIADEWRANGEALAKVFRGVLIPPKSEKEVIAERTNPVYPVPIDYGMSMEQLIKLGQYDWSNKDINSKHFPTKRTGKVDITIELVHLNRNISSKDAIRELDHMGLRPAEGCELLAFGSKYPDVQREFPIVALASVWRRSDGYRRVVCLDGRGAERSAGLGWFEDGWYDRWRFAAVRK